MLCFSGQGVSARKAVITYGAFDTVNCSESTLFYGPNPLKHTWAVHIESLSFPKTNASPKRHFSEQLRPIKLDAVAKVDLSMAFVYGPEKILDRVAKELGAEKRNVLYHIPCDKKADLPDLSFRIGGHEVVYFAKDYFYQVSLFDCLIDPLPMS